MKKVYVAHPLLGDTDTENFDPIIPLQNKHRASEICREIAGKYPHILILSPIHAFSFLSALDRERPLELCRKLLSLADELWVFGDWQTSEGCRKEIEHARALGLPVVFYGRDEDDRSGLDKPEEGERIG